LIQRDPAKAVKDALAVSLPVKVPAVIVTLEVPDDYQPAPGKPVLLVADDGGAAVIGGPWLVGSDLMEITLRLTSFAAGRTEARQVLGDAVKELMALVANRKPVAQVDKDLVEAVARIEGVPPMTDTRDRATGAVLASIEIPVLVRP
jgi:hypothetical protein